MSNGIQPRSYPDIHGKKSVSKALGTKATAVACSKVRVSPRVTYFVVSANDMSDGSAIITNSPTDRQSWQINGFIGAKSF